MTQDLRNPKRKPVLPQFSDIKAVHIVGVGGTLMGAFAAFLKRRGITVSGSDQNVYPPMSDVLAAAGIQVFTPYAAENLTGLSQKPELVVIGNVITPENPEARAAIDEDYVFSSLPEAMEKLMLSQTRNCVVSGTHGKTTTSSLLAHVLTQAGLDPCYFIGGVSADLPQSFHVSSLENGRPFVLEGDEYDTAFWDKVPKFNHYLPDHVILTSVEFDHADIYPDFAAVYRAFEGLLARIREGGQLIACLDYPAIHDLLKGWDRKDQLPVLTYASNGDSGARFWPTNVKSDGEGIRFDVIEKGAKVDEIVIRLPGNHNALNALAAWIECESLGVPRDAIRKGLASFRGIKRRQEVRGDVNGVTVVDDFAHHPTAVRETLRALRMKYPGRRLIAVFEPRSATSRRKIFQKEFAAAFAEADVTYIAVPYDQTLISQDDQFSSDELVADIRAVGRVGELMHSVEEGVSQVAHASKPGDLIAVLSNGSFGGFIPKLLSALA